MTATITNLPSQYEPFSTEAKWQKFWEENHIYKADPSHGGKPYCIVIPPPNVTGSLHMGHAFDNSLIDVLVRYHRMKGCNALYLPGTDHASIAVHTVLEKQLKAEGKTRYELGRDKFLERAWQWKEQSKGTIVGQLRRLGVSVDWTRERFTLDEGLSKAVLEAFNRLYEEGLIYRGKYLVNWCPESQSAVSDLEVEAKEVNGNLWHFRYPLTDGSGYVEVATTRPETMLGDTAVAVNPNDDRYKHLIGKMLNLPIMNREIPIIGDEYVDASFGTGCVKVTPAHDLNDFEMGQRHNLPFINIMNKDGTLNENAGEFQGQDRFVARKNVVARLEADGFLVKVEDYKHTVPYSDRGKVPVEPLLSTQWFVKIRPMADRCLEFLDQRNSPHFVPQRWTKVYRDWLVKLKDWCISRQLWWGHQIPAWYAVSETGGEITDNTPFVVARNDAEAQEKLKSQFGENVKVERDTDVLDTWFSSGLWPFSTLGWPEQTQDLATYYPTSTLVTGFDIIFFWVARMTMMAGHFTGQMPFQDVYIHGLVLDENGKKMSKSANNGVDPLLLMEKYGTDALRYTLIKEVVGAGQDIRLDYNRKTDESPSVEASRNFANKLWNAARFVMMNLDGQTPQQLGEPHPPAPSPLSREGEVGLSSASGGTEGGRYGLSSASGGIEGGRYGLPPASGGIEGGLELSDRWILSRYYQVVQQTNNYMDNYGLGEAAKGLYDFIWGDFCDWYIELVKSRLQKDADPASRRVAQQTLAYVLEGILKLLSPFMPHITEEIWHTLTQQPADSRDSLTLKRYPEAKINFIDPGLEEQFELLIGTIRTIRNLRAEADVKPGMKVNVNLQSDSEQERQILTVGQSYIKDLAKVENLSIAGGKKQEVVNVQQSRISWTQIAIIIGVIYLLRVGLAVGDTINDIPFIGDFFEMVGFGYAAWFVIRYLLNAEARQKLWQQFFKPTVDKNLPKVEPQQPQPEPEKAIADVVGTVQVLLPLAGVADVEAFTAKIQKRLSKIEAEIQSLSARLSNAKFVEQAPADVVKGARDALAEAQKQAEILRDRLRQLA